MTSPARPSTWRPSCSRAGPADQRCDIYALGTLLFYLVTGRFPVAGRSLTEIREAHARGERTRLRDLRADVPVRSCAPSRKRFTPTRCNAFRRPERWRLRSRPSSRQGPAASLPQGARDGLQRRRSVS